MRLERHDKRTRLTFCFSPGECVRRIGTIHRTAVRASSGTTSLSSSSRFAPSSAERIRASRYVAPWVSQTGERDLRPSQVLTSENMHWQPWPETALNPVYITRSARPDAPETLAGSIVCYRMSFSEPIREANLAPRHVGSAAAKCPVAADKSSVVPLTVIQAGATGRYDRETGQPLKR
jgi:hypothetical protein